jgi:hypothetical protein
MNRRALAAWAGIIGPALFVATFTLEGWMRSGYSARSMFVSELALGPHGWTQCVNFVVFGALFLVFARGVTAEFPDGKASRAGPILLTIIGFSLLVSGFFVMDPVTTAPDQMTIHGKLHQFFGALVFSLSPGSCFVFLRRFHADPKWRPLQWWTLAAGIITTAAVVLLSAGPTRAPAPPNAFNEWNGLIQRMILIPYFAWQFSFAMELRKRSQNARAT